MGAGALLLLALALDLLNLGSGLVDDLFLALLALAGGLGGDCFHQGHGTVEGGLEVLRGFLNQAGVPADHYAFYDGSGLSRQNLVTPHAVVQLLRYADSEPWGTSFRDTLPVGGVDGSLSDRFKNVAEQGHIYAKTGSLGGVKSLSGYATTQLGDRIAFSILSNNFNLPNKRVTDTIDAIIEAIVEDAASRKE